MAGGGGGGGILSSFMEHEILSSSSFSQTVESTRSVYFRNGFPCTICFQPFLLRRNFVWKLPNRPFQINDALSIELTDERQLETSVCT